MRSPANQEMIASIREEGRKRRRGFYSSLPEREWDITFEKLNPDAHVLRVMKWSPQMQKGGILLGPPGLGKSTLGKALINRWASEQYRAVFITMSGILDNIRNAFESEHTTPGIELEKLIRPDFLFIDDLGTEKTSEFTEEKMFAIVDTRNRLGKHTWYSTNLSMDEIQKRYSARIADRLFEGCSLIKCEGESYRRRGFKNEI